MNLTTDASTWLKKKVASNCHHHMVAELMLRMSWPELVVVSGDESLWVVVVGTGMLLVCALVRVFQTVRSSMTEQTAHDLVQSIAQMEELWPLLGRRFTTLAYVLRREKTVPELRGQQQEQEQQELQEYAKALCRLLW